MAFDALLAGLHLNRIIGICPSRISCSAMANSITSDKSEIVSSWVEQFGDQLYAWALKRVDESTAKDLVQ